jgi:D-alanyl-D-alanine carboxypeptidase (penicillin-binding protein 5/6)
MVTNSLMLKRVLLLLNVTIFVFFSVYVSSEENPRQIIIPAPPQLAATAYLLIDANSGRVLAQRNADKALPPASITKLMASYIVSTEIERGSININDKVNISVEAWKKGGSKMFIREGTQVSVIDLVRGMIIQSGNDATIALAEHVAGSESAFVDVMNQQADMLGLTNTHFMNATGWPEDGHYSSPRDIAILTKALISEFPQSYNYYSEKYFSYNGINQPNRNKLLFRDKTIDGVKTGHTDEAGYCLVASSEKKGMRLISVVMGTSSDSARAQETQKLLAYGFRYYHTHKLYEKNSTVSTAQVWKGQSESIDLGVTQDIYLTVPRGSEDSLVAKASVDNFIEAPVGINQELGSVIITLDGETLLNAPLVSLKAVDEAGLLSRIYDGVALFFHRFTAP